MSIFCFLMILVSVNRGILLVTGIWLHFAILCTIYIVKVASLTAKFTNFRTSKVVSLFHHRPFNHAAGQGNILKVLSETVQPRLMVSICFSFVLPPHVSFLFRRFFIPPNFSLLRRFFSLFLFIYFFVCRVYNYRHCSSIVFLCIIVKYVKCSF